MINNATFTQNDQNSNKTTTICINISLSFDLLISENLDDMLLKLYELILRCSFVRVAQCFDFINFVTENRDSQQFVLLDIEMSCELFFF